LSAGTVAGVTRICSPQLIGRGSELARLGELRRRATEGLPCVALVKGEAGIGKSRLVGEFINSVEAGDGGVLRGNCFPIAGEDAPYGPLLSALRGVPGEMLEAAAEGLATAIRAELSMLIPALPHPTEGARDASRGAQGRQYEYLLELLARLAGTQPLVLVIEDIHWADPSTLDFLSFAARNALRERLLIIVTYRLHDGSRPLDRYVAELERCAAVESIALDPLSEEQVQAQIEAILRRPAPASFAHRIAARTQGNPFYVEELIAHGDTAEAPLGAVHAATLLERVRALPKPAQRIMEVLAAFGRAVHHELLGAASAMPEPALTEALHSAVEAHVAHADGTDLTFRHALTREAVYDALMPGERRRLHAAVATALTARPHMTDVAELAVQWRAAEEPVAALTASIAAARAATGVYAYTEAVDHYAAVVSLWGRASAPDLDVDHAQLLLDAADAAYRAGVDELPIRWCQAGLKALGDAPDPRRAAIFFERLGRFQHYHPDESLSHYHEALARLDNAPSAERARVLGDESLALTLSVRWDEARERAEQALAVALEAGAQAEEGFARSVLGLVVAYLGEFDSAEVHLNEARRIGEHLERPEDAARAYVHLGEVRRLRGDLAGALGVMHAGAACARRLGVEASYGRYFALNAASDEYEVGRWTDAQARIARLGGASLTWSEALLHDTVSGLVATGRGEFGQARDWLDAAAARLRPESATEWSAYVGAARVELLVAERDTDAFAVAARELERARGREEQLYTPALVAVAARAGADAPSTDALALLEERLRWLDGFLEGGSPPTARVHLASAHAEHERALGRSTATSWGMVADGWERLGHPYREAYARSRQAEAELAAKGDRAVATAALARALSIAEALQALPLVTWTEELTQRSRLSTAVAQTRPARRAEELLTPREFDVLRLLVQGASNRAIGEELFITEGTAALHVSRIISKYGVKTRVQVAAKARDEGFSEGA